MFEVNIKVDPQNSSDMQHALEVILNQPCISRFKETYYNKSSYLTGNLAGNSRNNQELIDQIKKLEKEIQMHQKENEKNQKLLSDKDAEIEKLQQSLEEQTKKIDEENKKNNELESGRVKALDEKVKIEEESKKQLETLKKEYNKNLTDKDKEISRLKKMLESYSVSFGSDDPSEKIYFEVSENGTLEESMISSDSLYCASKSGSIYKFTINTDDGPIIKAISDVNRYLIPYCDIQNQIEGANTILILSIGEAKLIGGSFQVEKKAVISLTKQ